MTKGSGELLKKHMKGADITTRELGEMLGWSRHTVIRWRQGHSGIRREQILQMQKILGLTRDEVNELLVSEGYRPLPPELEPALSRPVRPPPLQRPAQTEHFVGREQELERVLQDLQPGRVVTLCGPGGVGKSALAAKVIWMLAKGSSPPPLFPDGVLMCRFSHNRQADLALEHIARTFGEEPRPTPQDAARRALAGVIACLG